MIISLFQGQRKHLTLKTICDLETPYLTLNSHLCVLSITIDHQLFHNRVNHISIYEKTVEIKSKKSASLLHSRCIVKLLPLSARCLQMDNIFSLKKEVKIFKNFERDCAGCFILVCIL